MSLKVKALESLMDILHKMPIEGMKDDKNPEGDGEDSDVKPEDKNPMEEDSESPDEEDSEEKSPLDSAEHDHDKEESCGDECPVKIELDKKFGR